MLPGTESVRGRMSPMCGLLPIERAGRYLLPPEVRANLRNGDPLNSNHIDGRLIPYLYPNDWISAVFGYLLSGSTLYSGESFKENIRQYINTFHLDDWLPVIRKRISQEDIIPLFERGFKSNSFIALEDMEPPERNRIFMQGRFNGPPTPAIIETVLRVKQELPDYEFIVGIDHDKSSIEKEGQASFMDVQFRASLLYHTGLFDRIVLLEPDYFWHDLYEKGSLLDSDVFVCSANDEIDEERWQEIPIRTAITVAEEMPREIRGMHQSTIKSGETSVLEVRHGWDVVRRLLSAPRQT